MKFKQRTRCSKFALEIHKRKYGHQMRFVRIYLEYLKLFKVPMILFYCYILLLVICCTQFATSTKSSFALNNPIDSSKSIEITQEPCYYYATFARWPLICGSRLQVAPINKAPNSNSNPNPNQNSNNNNFNQNNQAHYVASFRAIPYAAPPIGVLRFMPPGAPSSNANLRQQTTTTTPNRQQQLYELMPGGKISNQIEEHTKAGLNCIQLANWLQDTEQSNSNYRQQAAAFESEDCLHLSIYVPVNGISNTNTNSNANLNSNNEQPKSNTISYKNNQQLLFNASAKIPGKFKRKRERERETSDFIDTYNHRVFVVLVISIVSVLIRATITLISMETSRYCRCCYLADRQ